MAEEKKWYQPLNTEQKMSKQNVINVVVIIVFTVSFIVSGFIYNEVNKLKLGISYNERLSKTELRVNEIVNFLNQATKQNGNGNN